MAIDTSTVQVVMPAMGDSVAEGTVLEWHKQEGDTVAVDETIVEISTDKVDAEVPSPVAGTIVKLYAAEAAPATPVSTEAPPATPQEQVAAAATEAEQAAAPAQTIDIVTPTGGESV